MTERRPVATTLPTVLHDRLRAVAGRLGLKIQSIIERAVIAVLDELEREERGRRRR